MNHKLIVLVIVLVLAVLGIVVVLYLKNKRSYIKNDGAICRHLDNSELKAGDAADVNNRNPVTLAECEKQCNASSKCKGFDMINISRDEKGEVTGTCGIHFYDPKPRFNDNNFCSDPAKCGCWIRK